MEEMCEPAKVILANTYLRLVNDALHKKEKDGVVEVRMTEQEIKENAAKKSIGRNNPCPCGSGKKYKNCCGR